MSAHNDCVFCKIIRGELPSNKVYEDEGVLVFHDIQPNAPVHVMLIPKKHIPTLNYVNKEHSTITAHIMALIPEIAKKLKIDESGYRIVVNCGEDSGMMVEHLHFHLLGGKPLPQKLG